MADQDSHSSRAEQRMLAVAKLKRAASLPRMKDGRRPPMHSEAVSEGEKAASEEEKPNSEEEKSNHPKENDTQEPENQPDKHKTSESNNHPPPDEKTADTELDLDTEPEERPMSPSQSTKKRRSRSRSRSRNSKDLKGKMRSPQSPPPLGGDSSQDENPPIPTSIIPIVPPLASPTPSRRALLPPHLRSPTPIATELSLFYPGTSPPTPLPTLEDLQKGLMRSNSAGSPATGRRMAMMKLTGGTETYDPSPSPTPPPSLGRNNTVSGGERIAARQNMLNRLGTRITKEADVDLNSGTEDRGAPSPTPKRRRRRSRRTSTTVNPNASMGVSDSDFNSTNPNTPALPPTPLPVLQDHYAELRALSTTPLSNPRDQNKEALSAPAPSPPAVQLEEEETDRPEQTRRRSILIEDPDEEPQQTNVTLPGTPQRTFIDSFRMPHLSDTHSNGTTDSTSTSAVTVPVYMGSRGPSRLDMFPSSPFTTPLKEKALSDEEEEQVLYPGSTARPRTPYANVTETYDREISWVASPLPEIRMPIDDDEEEEDAIDPEAYPNEDIERQLEIEEEDEVPLSATSSNGFNPDGYDDVSPRASFSSKSVFVESEISPENPQFYIPAFSPSPSPSPSPAPAPISQPASLAHATSDSSASLHFVPTRLSVASRMQGGDRSPLTTEYPEWDDSPKRNENPSASTWEKVKNTFSRAGSSTGRRSRTNSILTRERRDNTDSSVSRESGASLTSAKTDKADPLPSPVQVQAPPLMQSPSASASILSLAPHAPPRGSVSPIPPASTADMSKYQNAKLFPFPGMLRLEEERRAKGYPSASASSPDVSLQSNFQEDQGQSLSSSSSNTPAETPELTRERKLSHQYSDTRLVTRYGLDAPSSTSPPSSYHPDYINISPSATQNGNSYKLPMTLPGVKQWLSKNSKKKTLSPGPSPGTSVTFSSPPTMDPKPTIITNKKPSLSDIVARKENEPITEWEDIAPANANLGTAVKKPHGARPPRNGVNGTKSPEPDHLESDQTPKVHNIVPLDLPVPSESPYKSPIKHSSLTRLYTPDPSSVSDYPAATASESSSTTSSQYSLGVHESPGSMVLERLDEKLARGTKNPMWASALDDPPRKLILSSPVLQVVNPNTVKDRFLFLFSDVLIIAKPVTWDQDKLIDAYKPSLPDRKYAVKSVVLLRNIRFCSDRSEGQPRTTNYALPPRNPIIRSFISQFSKDPDHAIASLFTKSNLPDNSVLLGQLLLKILDLDRSRLGEYLSKRTSKAVLKSYLDSFGFTGLRVDVALRVFLHSVNVPRAPQTYGSLEHLLDSFASRWYEANARFVAYDKDMAIRLVRAIVQLNELLHDGIAEQPGPTDHVRRNVTSKEFQDAFRRYDTRYLVSDEVLAELYRSIFHERLCQACTSLPGSQDIPITIKRQLPVRLTYKAQSEPIIFRLPQADPLLSIKLYGQDLIFDPPVLQFSRSSEASFRVTGTSLGSKTMTMCRTGPNAVKYSGLPLSHTVVVERAFMRNTFQLAFLNQSGEKRRYMFSIDDTIIRNEWATSLKRHIDIACGASSLPEASEFYTAAEATAFKVLQDTLMSSSRAPASYNLPNSPYSNGGSAPLTGFSIPSTGPLHIRSKSRSKIYHRHGEGKNEVDLGHRSPNSSRESNDLNQDLSDHANSPDHCPEGHVWTARDLEMYCLQNSSIPLVLSYLQVGAPDHITPS